MMRGWKEHILSIQGAQIPNNLPPITPREAGDEVVHDSFRAAQASFHSNTSVHCTTMGELKQQVSNYLEASKQNLR